MGRHLLPRFGLAALLAVATLGLSIGLGSADGDLEDYKLEAFITAALAVDQVMESWQPRIVRAKDDRQVADLRARANREIERSIERVDGITLPEYRQIRQTIAADPAMLERVRVIMRRQQPH